MYSPNPVVYSVAQLNNYVKNILDKDENLANVFVTGEISNFKPHYSGHLYMTIKDETAAIRAVMFSNSAMRLRFSVENGMKVLIFGRISLFERDGSYQLYINDMQPDGIGSLNLAFEQLKKKLEKEGLFDPYHKKEMPKFPKRVGVVTSATGAAVQDIFNVLARRYPVSEVVLRPCKVQGEGAAEDVAQAIKEFNEKNAADVLIVGRGGGSIEDLWAFNEEIVARAVFDSRIPVISAVGHETDFTICDFVADLRAPTPSAAAECAVPDIRDLKDNLSMWSSRLVGNIRNAIENNRNILRLIEQSPVLKEPERWLQDNRRDVLYLSEKLLSQTETAVLEERNNLSSLAGKLGALSPLGVIARGYAMAQKDGKVLSRAADVKSGDEIILNFSDGIVNATVNSVRNDINGSKL